MQGYTRFQGSTLPFQAALQRPVRPSSRCAIMAWALVSILALDRVGLVSEIDPATAPIQWPELGRQVAQEPSVVTLTLVSRARLFRG
jgi:hypothetical protein